MKNILIIKGFISAEPRNNDSNRVSECVKEKLMRKVTMQIAHNFKIDM